MIKAISYPRAAVVGNPSDGFFGKTIAFPFSNFQVEARLTVRDSIVISQGEDGTNLGLAALYQAYLQKGVDKKNPLLSASVKRFYEYCQTESIDLHDEGFEIEFESTIPREVGLAGSSAIITAIFRTLLAYYRVDIPRELLANLILEVETLELGISAGLQDRVVQVYEKPVYMDFDKELMAERDYGEYEVLAPELFQNIYIAYRRTGAESSDIVHNDLGSRYQMGDQKVHGVMKELSSLTESFLDELKGGGSSVRISEYMNRNFDLRQSICAISRNNLEMIDIARSEGASAKFTGSGGAIIGVFESQDMYERLKASFLEKDIQIFEPTIVSTETW
ncbi:MAG: GHMP kinase [Roseivirga sp.]|nr:GHMP kinase [Roseivirga sp.]